MPLRTGNRTVVTVQVPRDNVPAFSTMLLRPLGFDLDAGVPRHVYMPASIETFAHLSGGGGKPSGGAFADLVEPELLLVSTNNAAFWGVELSRLGGYFGWMARGARVEFVTSHGATYSVTFSYMLLPGHQEDHRLLLLDTFLRSGGDSYSAALTERAADRFSHKITTLEIPEAS